MSINQLILRNLKKNVQSYYLYVFALIFSAALYLMFVTLQYDPSMDEATGSIKGAAAVRTASILLVAIVSIFLLYANNLFIKRRSKEIGLFQLIGLTKNRIFWILSAENLILYFSSVLIGSILGFSASKLVTMILFKVTDVEAVASLHFSAQAFWQTIMVFSGISLLILLMNYVFIKHQSILSLFHVRSKTEIHIKKISIIEGFMGVCGILLIAGGYYVSSKLFDGDFVSINQLFLAMIFILSSVIIGTYFFYKGSVCFLANILRKNKDGYLNINQVMSMSSIMFRMKSNAVLLTVITTVSALAIGLLSLSYISYYSAEKTAESNAPADFAFISTEDANAFGDVLAEHEIGYNDLTREVVMAEINIKDIVGTNIDDLNTNGGMMTMPIVSDSYVENVDVSQNETQFTGSSDAMQQLMSFKESGDIVIHGLNEAIEREYIGVTKEDVLPLYFTAGLPTVVVDDDTFKKISADSNADIQRESSVFVGFNLENASSIEEANHLFQEMPLSEEHGNASQYASAQIQKQNMGLYMFIVGFLGLTFLITSGCILYFKQMDESEEEQPNYTILRKLGFTIKDLVKGIQGKQLFNFGIPLIVGLLHSYFAVQSGWFFFGTEVWTPMLLVMGIYTALYSIFGLLSVIYYKKIIKESLK
ncbi:FtsX-like permease family protein [Alteribacillus sp. YIM 98480]|uniref:FtsX-like permease family protein n=1 Tax=Alteribacillus sp. YIM 98480 TaxID=2606599 RepID=UPI00131CAE14|nr:ABC transporter permease [Alteribacillus sp. YIM 98480]